ncbi:MULTISPECIES: hypothetical protein [Roseomonadaceae]|uniref:Baseplate assembly protein n=1 Tax=Falsiroseomonas oleicola TaxID=2801474 RepID=A0ABS6HE74_9PROT|nr:hypothetical protein [Roseomonas oleicola]MBU8545786.1 hypothetical protein [Roseomonas oleicola]
MTFQEQDRAMYRHPSGAVVTVTPDGGIEARHPSGAYIRIGDGAPAALGSVAANGWTPPSGGSAEVSLATSSVTLLVKPGGEVELTCTTLKVMGDITATGDITAGAVTLQNHQHSDVEPGGGNSGPPVP